MKAIVYNEYGPPEVLHLEEVPQPVPRDNEVLVRIRTVSINDWDWGLLTGTPLANRFISGIRKPKYRILGSDIAGQVEAVGRSVRRFQPGDAVFGDLSGRWGGFAEYVSAREDALTLKPAGMTFEEAAAIPQAGLLAWQGIREKGQVLPGQRVLINGAGGGAGTFAIQIAKSFGAEVTGVDSTRKLDTMHALGADQVIDYTQEDFTRKGQRYDWIIDFAGYHPVRDYQRALSPQGNYIIVGGATTLVSQIIFLGPLISLTTGKKMSLLLHQANRGLDAMTELCAAGKVRPAIDQRYPLCEAAAALRYFGAGQARGKIVITVPQNF